MIPTLPKWSEPFQLASLDADWDNKPASAGTYIVRCVREILRAWGNDKRGILYIGQSRSLFLEQDFLLDLFLILEYRMPMNLLPQDVLIMIKLVISSSGGWTYNTIAYELGMSPSMVFNGVKRATQARIFDPNRKRPRRKALEEFLIHGMKYAFPPDIGSMTRGIPTVFASPALRGHLSYDSEEIYVWPYPQGHERGISFSPLYKSVPEIAMKDEKLYAALGLVDAIRLGRVRENKLAERLLFDMLRYNA